MSQHTPQQLVFPCGKICTAVKNVFVVRSVYVYYSYNLMGVEYNSGFPPYPSNRRRQFWVFPIFYQQQKIVWVLSHILTATPLLSPFIM
jgi:hypothetical protein